jgi:hypothetical protein
MKTTKKESLSRTRYYVRAKENVDEKTFQELGAEHVVPVFKGSGFFVLSVPNERVLKKCATFCTDGPEEEIEFHITLLDMQDKGTLPLSPKSKSTEEKAASSSSSIQTRYNTRNNNREKPSTDKPNKRGRKL